jgi:hypothetical protein
VTVHPAARTVTLSTAMVAVAVVAFIAAALGIGVRATFGAHVAVDETQYVLSALSLAEDGNLDISDELAQKRWRDFADVEPPVQTQVLGDGRQISPHDPLLPALLAVPVALGGWVAAKLTLAALAGLLAALTLWVAVRRLRLSLPLAATGVGIAAASAPLAVYGQQIYPELPAALVTVAGFAALTGPLATAESVDGPGGKHRGGIRNVAVLALAVAALPWLSIKYSAVAAALALLGVVRWWRSGHRREAAGLAAGVALGAGGYLIAHRLVWGGWTVYASGDHFQQSGEFGVVGFHPHYVGRALRLVGLFVDREYGIATWQPAWLLVLPAVAALIGATVAARRPLALLPLLLAGWMVATFVAVTMHGFWWPGRQLVVVLPLALLLVLWWLQRSPPVMRRVAFGLGLAGVLSYTMLLVDGYHGEITWVTGFQRVDDPVYSLIRHALPDYRGDFWPLHIAWVVAFAALLVAGYRSTRSGAAPATARGATPSAPVIGHRALVSPKGSSR